jgi:hypothetical protein
MSEPSLIPGTRELYSFVLSNTIIITLMTGFRQLQNDGAELLKSMPALPELVELIRNPILTFQNNSWKSSRKRRKHLRLLNGLQR